ncbi:MAG: type IV pilus modification protein PilV [Saezia sp.]
MKIQMMKHKRQKTRGFTLLEVLVSILILSLGAVTALGLNIAAIKAANDAHYQLKAISLASDLASLMNANPDQAGASASVYYQLNSTTTETQGAGLSEITSTSGIAKRDIDLWYARVEKELPGARVVVCFDATPFDAQGVPQWACSGSGVPYIKIGWRMGDRRQAPATPSIVIPVGLCDPFSTTATLSCAA